MILLVDKPTGWTSHDLVKYVKIHGKYNKVGHAGTLDPLATGLMLLLTDEDTKKMSTFVGYDKWYTATIDLSHISDTWDADYHEIYEGVSIDVPPTYDSVQKTLQGFIPTATLPLPSFSAKKIAGKRMYKSARAGVVHDVAKEMTIFTIEILDYVFPSLTIRCHVGSGTFIRSIAFALGQQLGTGGIITALRRETIGKYSLSDDTCIKNLSDIKQNNLSHSDTNANDGQL